MAQNQTVQTEVDVADFINTVEDIAKRNDSFRVMEIFESATGLKAKMWGPAIIGFGSYHYKYDSGREGDAPLAGFSPRKDAIALYLSSSFAEREKLLQRLGKYKAAKACIYIKKLSDVDAAVLKEMVSASVSHIKSKHN